METLNKYVNMEAVAKYMNYETVSKYVNLQDPLLYATFAHVLFNPLAWNCVARLIIFVIGLTRDFLYQRMLENQPSFTPLEDMYSWPHTKLTIDIVAGLLLVFGNTLVLGAYYQLGLIGTYLGDYFGILLPNKVSGFPFSISSSPMYDGSTINFLAVALYKRSIAGAVVALFVFICYRIACIFEDSFTEKIYAAAAKKAQKTPKKTPEKATPKATPKTTPEKAPKKSLKKSSKKPQKAD